MGSDLLKSCQEHKIKKHQFNPETHQPVHESQELGISHFGFSIHFNNILTQNFTLMKTISFKIKKISELVLN